MKRWIVSFLLTLFLLTFVSPRFPGLTMFLRPLIHLLSFARSYIGVIGGVEAFSADNYSSAIHIRDDPAPCSLKSVPPTFGWVCLLVLGVRRRLTLYHLPSVWPCGLESAKRSHLDRKTGTIDQLYAKQNTNYGQLQENTAFTCCNSCRASSVANVSVAGT